MSRKEKDKKLGRTRLIRPEDSKHYKSDVEKYIEDQESELDELKTMIRRNFDSYDVGDVIFCT